MGDVVNLNRIRKRTAQDQAVKQADVNRAKFGRNKAERENAKRKTDIANRLLDQHQLPRDGSC